MKQELVPALMDIEARIAVKDGKVEKKPHGHGDVHALLHQQLVFRFRAHQKMS